MSTGKPEKQNEHSGGESGWKEWWRKAMGSVVIAGMMFVGPRVADARRSPTIEKEQETEFVLPSQKAAMRRAAGAGDRNEAIRVWGKRLGVVALAGLGVGGVVQTGRVVGRRWQKKRMQEFQKSLGSLGLEGPTDTKNSSRKSNAREDAKRYLQRGKQKYKFKSEKDEVEGAGEDIASKINLDIFKRKSSDSGTSKAESRPAGTPVNDKPENDFEKGMLEAISIVQDGGDSKSALKKWTERESVKSMPDVERRSMFDSFGSRLMSASIDKAGTLLDSDASEALKVLSAIMKRFKAVKALAAANGSSVEGLNYRGVYSESDRTRDELYRRYAVFCLSTEERVKENFENLVDMQNLLGVPNDRAEAINSEIAKGMFQVAVSAAMADGSLNEESRATLDKLKESFGDFLDGDSANSIMSEVSVMRAMYALQALLKEQGVSEEDVAQLRKMCSELGVDIDEMMQNADALGAALGPEAKEFVESLKTLLANPTKGGSAVNDLKDATPSTTEQTTASLKGTSLPSGDKES